MTLIANTYCTVAEVKRFFSTAGVESFSQENQTGEINTTVVEDCINEASQEIELYLSAWHDAAGLTSSSLVNRWCVLIATFHLCHSRGSSPPNGLLQKYEQVTGTLELLADGKRRLPGVALRADLRPTMSNLTVDRRFQRSTIRVTRSNSTDAPTVLTQDHAYDFPVTLD